MSSPSPIGSTTPSQAGQAAAAASPSSAANPLGGLTMNDFLTLMTAQLQNQDPLSPTDSNQFLAQLSELSTVEGISQMNTTMTNLSTSLLSSQALSSASLVGQSVLTPASAASYTSGGTLSGAVQVPTGASSVTLTITNAAGAIVNQTALSPSSGLQSFAWNGTAENDQSAQALSNAVRPLALREAFLHRRRRKALAAILPSAGAGHRPTRPAEADDPRRPPLAVGNDFR